MINGLDSSTAWQVASSYAGSSVSSRAQDTSRTANGDKQDTSQKTQSKSTNAELSAAELKQVEDLQRIDRKVQAHEMAHMAAGAGLVRGGPTYGYETGPDGRRYAVSGEVSIDGSPADTPERTVTKAARIQAAALAPADPSAQDRRVAASAEQMAMEARMQIAQQRSAAAGSDRASDTSDTKAYGRSGNLSDAETLGSRIDAFA